jgi:hypothetical protein
VSLVLILRVNSDGAEKRERELREKARGGEGVIGRREQSRTIFISATLFLRLSMPAPATIAANVGQGNTT